MSRPAANAPPPTSTAEPLTTLPRAPSYFSDSQRVAYQRIGKALVAAGTITGADLLMVEAAARVLANITRMYALPAVSLATLAALERLHKEQLIQLGLTPAARKSAPKLTPKADDGVKGLLD